MIPRGISLGNAVFCQSILSGRTAFLKDKVQQCSLKLLALRAALSFMEALEIVPVGFNTA